MDRKIKLQRIFDEFVQPFAHLFAAPWCNGSVVYRLTFVRDDEVWVNTDNFTIALAAFTRSIGIVEAEKVRRWLFKGHPIQFKLVGIVPFAAVDVHVAFSLSLQKSCLQRVGDTAICIVLVRSEERRVGKEGRARWSQH